MGLAIVPSEAYHKAQSSRIAVNSASPVGQLVVHAQRMYERKDLSEQRGSVRSISTAGTARLRNPIIADSATRLNSDLLSQSEKDPAPSPCPLPQQRGRGAWEGLATFRSVSTVSLGEGLEGRSAIMAGRK
jgi:hypothetical protein